MSAFANQPVDVVADSPVVAATVVTPVAPDAKRAVAIDAATDAGPTPAATPTPAPDDDLAGGAPDTALVSALHRVADSFERVAISLDADRRDRGARLDDVETLLREFMTGLRPTAVPPVVIGGSIEPHNAVSGAAVSGDAVSGDAVPADAQPGTARKKRPRAKVARDEIEPPEGQIDLSLAELEGNR